MYNFKLTIHNKLLWLPNLYTAATVLLQRYMDLSPISPSPRLCGGSVTSWSWSGLYLNPGPGHFKLPVHMLYLLFWLFFHGVNVDIFLGTQFVTISWQALIRVRHQVIMHARSLESKKCKSCSKCSTIVSEQALQSRMEQRESRKKENRKERRSNARTSTSL